MGYETILYAEDGPVATLTLNRPDDGNMFTETMCHEVRDCINVVRRETRTRVLVITGAGDKFFCIGGRKAGMEETRLYPGVLPTLDMYESIERLQKPVIAAVNGYALGAGLELVMSCDIAITADHAQLGMPEVKVGLPSVIECALMPNIIGLMRTRELLLTGDNIDAHEAYRIGLVNQVVPLAELPVAVRRMAQRLASNGPRALFLQKELLNRWLNLPMDEAIEAGIKSLAMAYATDAPQRAIEAFWARRGKR